MNRVSNVLALALAVSSVITATAQTKQPPSVLGKTDINALIEAAPAMPGNTPDAVHRAEATERHLRSLFPAGCSRA
jgi:hypothetical protein